MSHFKTSILAFLIAIGSSSFAQVCEVKLDELPRSCPQVVGVADLPVGLDFEGRHAEITRRLAETTAQMRSCMNAQSECTTKCGEEFRSAKLEFDEDKASHIQDISVACTDYQQTINNLIGLRTEYIGLAADLKAQMMQVKGAPSDRTVGPATAMTTLPGFLK